MTKSLARISAGGLLALGLALGPAGCSKSPSSGGPTPPVATRQRLAVTMRLQQPLINSNYYAFAFDDDDNSGDGPQAVVGPTSLTNGVVGGSFTVLVLLRGGQFQVFRRVDRGNGNESLDRAARAFVTTPLASGTLISFVLDLTARTDAGVPLFNPGTARLDTNFITTDEVRRDPNDLRRNAFDAFYPGSPASYFTFDIRATRTYTNGTTVQEPAGDVRSDSGAGNLGALDIVDFSLAVERS